MPQEYRAPHDAKQKEYFKHPQPRVFRNLEGLRKDGTVFPVYIGLTPLISRHGTLVMAVLREADDDG
jgi:hypothetical protein